MFYIRYTSQSADRPPIYNY